jgi:flavin-dependent dehydrogenase
VAALVLARAGVRVRLIDRARFPRDKLCGDTVNPGTMSILGRLGVSEHVSRRALPITGMSITGPGGTTVSADYPPGVAGAAIARRELDTLLLEAAIRAGVVFESGMAVRAPLLGTTVSRVTGVRAGAADHDRDLEARVVIAADGRHSNVAFALGLSGYARAPKRWAFGAYFVDVDRVSSHGEMHIRADGYIGVAPLPGNLVNVCVVRERDRLARTPAARTETFVHDAVQRDPLLRERFIRARQVSATVSLGPLAVDSRAPGCPGLLLAGDAAGFVDPMTGDGLRFAIRGGELAAEAALLELSSGEPAWRGLHVARAKEFGSKWRINRGLRALVASPRAVRVASWVSRGWQAPVRTIVRTAGDVKLVQHAS